MAISFGDPVTKGFGATPSVAVNNQSVVVAVHEDAGKLYYRVGRANKPGLTLELGDSHVLAQGGSDNLFPSVTLANSNLVVCVFESNNSLYSIAGRVDADAGIIKLGNVQPYDSGKRPGAAVRDDGIVIEVHMSESGSGIYCTVGKVQSDLTIRWPKGSRKYDTGQAPKVALRGDLALEVHRSESTPPTLYYNVGMIDARDSRNLSCAFNDGVKYYDTRNSGGNSNSEPSPVIALTSELIAIEFHDVDRIESTLAYFFGTVDNTSGKVLWPEKPTAIDFGASPSVSVNDEGVAVLAYTHNNALTYRVGRF